MTQTDTELDRIERSIEIDATAERVWSLVTRPGWWINEHDVEPDTETRDEGDGVTLVMHPKWGEFRIATEETDEPRYVRYRWNDPEGAGGTTVEFWVDDRPGGVTLRVLESGIVSLGKSQADLAKYHAGNSEGWELELAAAARFVLGTP